MGTIIVNTIRHWSPRCHKQRIMQYVTFREMNISSQKTEYGLKCKCGYERMLKHPIKP